MWGNPELRMKVFLIKPFDHNLCIANWSISSLKRIERPILANRPATKRGGNRAIYPSQNFQKHI